MHPRRIAQEVLRCQGLKFRLFGTMEHQPQLAHAAGAQPATDYFPYVRVPERDPVVATFFNGQQCRLFHLHQHFGTEDGCKIQQCCALRAGKDFDDGPVGLRFARQSGADKVLHYRGALQFDPVTECPDGVVEDQVARVPLLFKKRVQEHGVSTYGGVQ
ncbi:hypothetical protein D3C86_1781840 [compost metagenome]